MQVTLHNIYWNVCTCYGQHRIVYLRDLNEAVNIIRPLKCSWSRAFTIFLKQQFTHLSPFSVSLIIILPGLPQGNIKYVANQLRCLPTRLEIQLDNIFVSSSLRWLTLPTNSRKGWLCKATGPESYNTKKPLQASPLQRPEISLPLQYFPQEILFPSAVGFPVKSYTRGWDRQFSHEIMHHLKKNTNHLLSTYRKVYLSVKPLTCIALHSRFYIWSETEFWEGHPYKRLVRYLSLMRPGQQLSHVSIEHGN